VNVPLNESGATSAGSSFIAAYAGGFRPAT